MKRVFFAVLVLICFYSNLFAYIDLDSIKHRLPGGINKIQPAIVPVADFNETKLYFDRKLYAENTGGAYDKDDIWFVEKINDKFFSEPINIGSPLNTNFSDVLFSLSPDGNIALIYGIYSKDAKKDGFSVIKNNNWNEPIPLNIKNYNNTGETFYGYLSPDQNILLLSLERKDTKGELDLYISFYDEKTKQYSAPKNLGSIINTNQSETAPFLAYDNKTLFFASMGHNSNGEYDLFTCKRLDNSWTNWSEPQNLGKYINSKFDENSFWMNPLGKTAYITSYDTTEKRKGIYKILIPKEFQPQNYAFVKGEVFEQQNARNYIDKQFKIKVVADKDISYYYTTKEHGFLFPVCGKECSVQIEDDGYTSNTIHINTYHKSEPEIINDNLIISRKKLESHIPELGTYEVYFDYNKSDLTASAQSILNDLIKANNIPVAEFTVLGYTDEKGSDDYNLKLSQKRAEQVKAYLIKHGIKSQGILAIGEGKLIYGDSNPDKNRKVIIKIEMIKE